MQTTTIKSLVKTYDDYQKIRIQTLNRLSNDTDPNFAGMALEIEAESKKFEKRVEKMLANQLLNYPISKWITSQRGLATIRASGLIAYLDPISRFDTVSKVWSYAGYAVQEYCSNCDKRILPYHKRHEWVTKTASRLQEQNDKKIRGKKAKPEELWKKAENMLCSCETPDSKSRGQRRVSGQLADFNPEFKKQVYLCVDQFVKQGSLYKELYQQFKYDYLNRPDLKAEMESRKKGESKGTAHIDAMARRKVAKIFLSHLWVEWRKLEGLPVTMPYAFSILGHTDYIEPEKTQA